MTNEEYKEKYPIGTKIRYTHKTVDTNKTGTIVGYSGNTPFIYLPEADKHIIFFRYPTFNGIKVTRCCDWGNIEKLPQKNEQLLFEFTKRD